MKYTLLILGSLTLYHQVHAQLYSSSLGCDTGTCPEIKNICAESKGEIEKFLCCISPTCLDSGLEDVPAKIRRHCENLTNQLDNVRCSFNNLKARQEDNNDDDNDVELIDDVDEDADVIGIIPPDDSDDDDVDEDADEIGIIPPDDSDDDDVDEDAGVVGVIPPDDSDDDDVDEDAGVVGVIPPEDETFPEFVESTTTAEVINEEQQSELEEIREDVSDLLDLITFTAAEPSLSTAISIDLADDVKDIVESFSTIIEDLGTGILESDDDDDGDGTSVGAIAGGVVGGLAFVAALLGFLLLHRRRRKRARLTVSETSDFTPAGDVVQPHKGEDKIVEAPDHPASSQLHGYSLLNSGVGTFSAGTFAQPYAAPFYYDPASAQLHGNQVQTSGAANPSVGVQPQHGASQYHRGPANGPVVGDLPTNSADPAPVAQLDREPANGSGLRYDATNYTELASSSSVVRR